MQNRNSKIPRKCIDCKKLYPPNSNRQRRCLVCRKIERMRYQREWNSRFPEKEKQYGKDKRDKIRVLVLGHYGNGKIECNCCGENTPQFMSIDHINGGGNKHRKVLKKKGVAFYRYLKIAGYPKGYQVLCHNCNQAKGYYGKCPHQIK